MKTRRRVLHRFAAGTAAVGLTFTAGCAGAGSLVVTLRHMPPELPPEKAADTVEMARDSGIDSPGGSTDATVAFMVTVP